MEGANMSLFNKMLASVGIGAAKVDTKLYESRLTAGDPLKGVVEIVGGNVEQTIDDIYLSLCATYVKEVDDRKVTKQAIVEKWKLSDPFTIGIGERKEIPFSVQLPADTPLTVGRTRVWLHTGLDIKNAIDPTDSDYVHIQPFPLMNAVFTAMDRLGFRLREAECKEVSYHLRKRLPFIQEFEFVPISGEFRGKLDEVEIMFFPNSHEEIEMLIQIDRRARGLVSLFAEALDLDETFVRMKVYKNDMPVMEQQLASVIRKYC
jgi:sporulation-control protein